MNYRRVVVTMNDVRMDLGLPGEIRYRKGLVSYYVSRRRVGVVAFVSRGQTEKLFDAELKHMGWEDAVLRAYGRALLQYDNRADALYARQMEAVRRFVAVPKVRPAMKEEP